jgi:hypothetical protein
MSPAVVRYDAGVALVAGLRQPAKFVKFLATRPPLMAPEVKGGPGAGRCPRAPAFPAAPASTLPRC